MRDFEFYNPVKIIFGKNSKKTKKESFESHSYISIINILLIGKDYDEFLQ